MATEAIPVISAWMAGFLRLVEEAAALEQACAFLGGHFDISRRQQEHLVCDTLHAPVEGVGEPAREIDQALREILVGALEIEDHRDRLLELVGDLLRIVEASRHNHVNPYGDRRRTAPTRGRSTAVRSFVGSGWVQSSNSRSRRRGSSRRTFG